ncbi:hypothetical protein DNHGIG_29740 [Collibacillus ludicampi]|jgi:hypothetical protein|uniref:Uncharacterized protein n=1 Tax=Collibacillus ludicampi TaxID=2771369 RepID=A0AAV4LHY7_9BACL|nr:hypothetical protein [Collibacillus ludicampi]GIM47425.1 hypothetical protein DNHGIG_29740 [Collibacillus ludicampi]
MSNRQDDLRKKMVPKNEEELLAWLRSHFTNGKDPLMELSERFSSPKRKTQHRRNWYDEEA